MLALPVFGMFCPKLKRISANRWLNLTSRGKRWHVIRRARTEMRQVQKTPKLLFSKKAHDVICRELLQYFKCDYRISGLANIALAHASQDLVTKFFEDCQEAAEHAGRKTIMLKDLEFVKAQWAKQDDRVMAATD